MDEVRIGRSEFPVKIGKQAIAEIAEKHVQLNLQALHLNNKELRTMMTLKALEEYLIEHACVPDFVVTLDE